MSMNRSALTPCTLATLRRSLSIALTSIVVGEGAAQAAVSIEFLGAAFPTDVSADGAVIVGNYGGNYETFRWTESTGVVLLGMSSVEVLGAGGGTPDVSADGTRISATILGADSTYATQGLWTQGMGWTETMPPPPLDGGILDMSYGSAWGLSGDGEILVGLYWRPGQPGGSAHASGWTPNTRVVDLGGNGHSSRANATNADGSVTVGWAERSDGTWQPTVWTSSGLHTLTPTEAFCEADGVTPDGTTIVGSTYDLAMNEFFAAAWDWNGVTWTERVLGQLPGTSPSGYVVGNGITADGKLVVGYNRFFFGSSTGFLWTEETGMIDVVNFLTENGVTLPPNYDVLSLSAVSDDGKVIVGNGQSTVPPFAPSGFVIRTSGAVGAPLVDGPREESPHILAWPNPTRGAANIALDVPSSTNANVGIYDATGRLVHRVLEGPITAGRRTMSWDGRDGDGAKVAPGVYTVCLESGTLRSTQKIVVVH
jgi:uncharacterized membrane protein